MEALKNFFSNFLGNVYSFLTKVLPTSPFRQYLEGYEDGGSGLLSAVNYFVPISTFIAILEVWVTAMFLYYLYHGLVYKLWYSKNESNLKERATFLTKIFSIIRRLFGKL